MRCAEHRSYTQEAIYIVHRNRERVETRERDQRLTLRKSIGAHRRRVSDACKACPLQRRGYEEAPLAGSLSVCLSLSLSLFLPRCLRLSPPPLSCSLSYSLFPRRENNPPNVEEAFAFPETGKRPFQSVRETARENGARVKIAGSVRASVSVRFWFHSRERERESTRNSDGTHTDVVGAPARHDERRKKEERVRVPSG